ncbi:hypothetical protein D3C87_475800 [compost metagenome]
MNKYTATFADGTTIARKTERAYGAAWRATWTNAKGYACSDTGFSISSDKVNAFKPQTAHVHRFMSTNERAAARAKNTAFLAEVGYRVEVVPTVLSA